MQYGNKFTNSSVIPFCSYNWDPQTHSQGKVLCSICLPTSPVRSDWGSRNRKLKLETQNRENNNNRPTFPPLLCISHQWPLGYPIMTPLREWQCLDFCQYRVQVVFLNNIVNYWWLRDWKENGVVNIHFYIWRGERDEGARLAQMLPSIF